MSHFADLAETLREQGEYHLASEVEIIRFKLRHAVSPKVRTLLASGRLIRAAKHAHRVSK